MRLIVFMLMDIFSSFDEYNCNVFSSTLFIWLFSLVFFFVFFSSYWLGFSRLTVLLDLIVGYISDQLDRSLGKKLSGFSVFVSGLFLFLLMMNFLGLIPYVFSQTCHLVVSFSLGFTLWFSLILSSLFYKVDVFLAHFLPVGAPLVLNPFLVLVETLSVLMRPFTLSIRLVANMSAGHIVIGLVGIYFSSALSGSLWTYSLLLFSFQVFYFLFEFGISLIQAYVFSLLIILYSDEHSY